jgi:hypothetical protein
MVMGRSSLIRLSLFAVGTSLRSLIVFQHNKLGSIGSYTVLVNSLTFFGWHHRQKWLAAH